MMTKLCPSGADSVTATSCPRGQKRGWETTTAQPAGFITPRPIHKTRVLGGSSFPPTLLATGDQLLATGDQLVAASGTGCGGH